MKARIFAAGMLFSAGSGWAAVTACSGSQQLSDFGAKSTSDGCYKNDVTFTNTGISNSSGLGSGGGTLPSWIDLTADTTFSQVTTPWTVSAKFSGDIPSEFAVTSPGSSGGSTAQTSVTLSYLTNSQDTAANDPGAPTPTPGYAFYINSITLDISGTTGNAGGSDTISVAQLFCVGNTTCTAANSITLSANFGNNSSTPTFTCSAGASETFATCPGLHSATANLGSVQPVLNTLTTYILTAHPVATAGPNSGVPTTTTLNFYSDTFGEIEMTPEPATFGLFSSALAVLGFLRSRRRPGK